MNTELALNLPEMLSARDVATLLKISRQAVEARMTGIAPTPCDGIKKWPIDLFPIDYVEQLRFARKRSGFWTFAEVLQQASPRWEPNFKFAALPAFSQAKAFKVRSVMLVYFATLDSGSNEHQANCAARQKWLEEFSAACNEKTIRRWSKKIEERGGIEWAQIAAYADRKSCDHIAARLESRTKKPKVPGELIRKFKLLCVQANMNATSAYNALEMDWQCGREVPGVGQMMEPRQAFPFKLAQLRKFKPSTAVCQMGNQGIAAALRDTIPHIDRGHETLRPCELYVMDDTRVNVTVLNDVNGNLAELKVYICMEVASRRIVGYVLREGNMKASDVDALMARVLRTAGIAHPRSGYKTKFLFERGTVACSPARQTFLEAMFPGQLVIARTSMNGGANLPGDYLQNNTGHWMGKGVIESFMRTLGNVTRHIAGQRGSVYQKAPTMVGYPGNPHQGSMAQESHALVQAARGAVYLKSEGTNTSPHALEATEEIGLKTPLLFASQFRQAFAAAIEYYNSKQDHRREGFRQLGRAKENGGLEYYTESSNERWSHLVWQLKQQGVEPQRISPQDAAMLLHRARPVTITKQGAYITVDKVRYRYFDEDSAACAQADRLTTAKKEFIALCDPDNDLSEIYILENQTASWDRATESLREGETPRFLEFLPLRDKAAVNDTVALGHAYESKRRVLRRRTYELAQITGEHLQDRADTREQNSKMLGVVTTTGDYHEVGSLSALSNSMKRERRRFAEKRESSPSRHIAKPSDIEAFAASLKTEEPA